MAANSAATGSSQSHKARANRLQNMAEHNAATLAAENDEVRAVIHHNIALGASASRAANLPFHIFGRRDTMPELHDLGHMNTSSQHYQD